MADENQTEQVVVEPPDWSQLISTAAATRPFPIRAHTYRKISYGSASRPVVLACDDGHDYVVKGRQNGRMIVNEQIVGALGRFLSAPVPPVCIVDVPGELIQMDPGSLGHLQVGTSHGSRLEVGCTDKQWIAYHDVSENRPRFAAIAVLYGWIPSGDHHTALRAPVRCTR